MKWIKEVPENCKDVRTASQQLDPDLFKLKKEGLNNTQHKNALEALSKYLNNQKKFFLGYQINNKMDYENDFKEYLNIHINNIGDPFTDGNLTMNSKVMERPLLDYYAELWHAQCPHDKANPESYWGYVLSMGSTEANFYGIWNARDYLSGKILLINSEKNVIAKDASSDGSSAQIPEGVLYYQAQPPEDNPNAYTPIVFYSQDTHYSIVKAMRVLNIQTFYSLGSEKYKCPLKYPTDYPTGFPRKYLGKNNWPLEVPSNSDGSIHIESFTKLVEFFVSRGYPILTCFNYGTTFKGAYDNVEDAIAAVVPILKKYNMYEREISYEENCVIKKSKRHGFWFHVDGAFSASYMPFIEMAINDCKFQVADGYKFPIFDFRIPEVHSISMSGHKWIGAPFPCGIFMSKIKYQLLPPDNPAYIGSPDTTFAGSRNGLAAMILWDYTAKHSYAAQIEKAINNEQFTHCAFERLKQLEKKINKDLWIERTPLALTIRFKQPNRDIIFKYSLSCESLYVNGEKRSYAHIFLLEHVNNELIDALICDLAQNDAFPDQSETVAEERNSEYIPLIGRSFK
jgi:histidine decarboxylase